MYKVLKNNKIILSTCNHVFKLLKPIRYSVQFESSFASKNYNTKTFAKYKYNNEYESTKGKNFKEIDLPIQKFATFEQEVKFRQNQAKNSILFKLDTKYDATNEVVQRLLNDLRDIKCSFQEPILIGNSLNVFALIEFKSSSCVNKVLDQYSQPFKQQQASATTRLVFYWPRKKTKQINYEKKYTVNDLTTDLNLKEYDIEFLKKQTNINDQIQTFYDSNKIDDINYRIRFLIGVIVEESISGIFRNCLCIPFGSSINKFGAKSADLDLSCSLNGNRSLKTNFFNDGFMSGKLYFLTNAEEKEAKKRNRNFNIFELFEMIIRNVLPRFKFLQAIPHARVPLLKFEARIGPIISCDLSLTTVEVSYLMTKLFWSYCKLDDRVAPIVFLIRYWAILTGIKQQRSPSPSLTSFQLTFLVLYYFSKMENPVIISIDNLLDKEQYSNLIKYEKCQDNSIELEEILSNLKITDHLHKYDLKNNMQLIDLFEGFFKFYSNFNFNENVIALSKTPLNKPISDNKIFIENPFTPSLNASKNVTPKNVVYFQDMCRLSSNLIQTSKSNLLLTEFFSEISSLSKKRYQKDRNIFDDMNL